MRTNPSLTGDQITPFIYCDIHCLLSIKITCVQCETVQKAYKAHFKRPYILENSHVITVGLYVP